MALIKDALSSLPAKPALFIAPLIVLVVLSLYYRDLHQRCAGIREQRTALTEALRSAASPGSFRLADFTAFAWNKVRIVASVKAGTIHDECPLDWNWQSGERDALIGGGLLSALIFGQQGKVVGYLELRNDEVEFRGAGDELTPETAVFDIGRGAGGSVTLTLRQD